MIDRRDDYHRRADRDFAIMGFLINFLFVWVAITVVALAALALWALFF